MGEGPEVEIPAALVAAPLDVDGIYDAARELTNALYDLGGGPRVHPWRLSELEEVNDAGRRGRVVTAVVELRDAVAGLGSSVKTKTPGVYKRGNRYVVVWRDRGTQHKEFFPTLALAREAKGKRDGGDRKPSTRHTFEAYALDWMVSSRGRTRGGLADSTRAAYRDSLERFALPFFGRVKLADVDAPMVREFVASMEASGQSAGSIRKHYAPLRAMLATAVEDGVIRYNAAAQVRVVVRDDRPAHQ